MRTLAVLFTLYAFSSAASIMTMDDKEFEKAMMDHMFSQGSLGPMMSLGAIMTQDDPEPEPVVSIDPEAVGDKDAAHDTEEVADDPKEVTAGEDARLPFNMFANGMMAMVFPNAMQGSPIPYGATQPSKKPGNGNNKHELSNGNGQRGGGSGAAASATSFSRGSNAFSSSQAQAFSGQGS